MDDTAVLVVADTHLGKKEMIFNCTPSQYLLGLDAYKGGALMQNAFPFLSPDEREFLISGTTPEEWATMFGGEDV
jgi:hypothetical protein